MTVARVQRETDNSTEKRCGQAFYAGQSVGRPKKKDETGIKDRLSVEMTKAYGRKGAGTRLAEAVAVSTGQASRWESGKNIPSLGMIVRISQALGVDPGWLAFGKDSAAPVPDGWREATTRGEAVERRRADVYVARDRRSAKKKGNPPPA